MCSYGDIFYADLPDLLGTQVQKGVRPVIVVSNNMNNYYSPVVNVVPLTSRMTKSNLPTHVAIDGHGLSKPSIILAEQIISLDKTNLLKKIGAISDDCLQKKIRKALMVQLNMVA